MQTLICPSLCPLQCMVNGVPGGMMNTYCWIHGTFTIPSQLTGVTLGEDVPHPGVAPKSNRQRNEEEPGHVRSVSQSPLCMYSAKVQTVYLG